MRAHLQVLDNVGKMKQAFANALTVDLLVHAQMAVRSTDARIMDAQAALRPDDEDFDERVTDITVHVAPAVATGAPPRTSRTADHFASIWACAHAQGPF